MPNLGPADQLRIQLGNITLKVVSRVVRLCNKFGILVCVENPHNSLVWESPPMLALARSVTTVVTDYCQFGTPWRKRTRVLVWNSYHTVPHNTRCSGRGGVCSKSRVKHIQLTGPHPTQGVPWTKVAEPYPWAWHGAACGHVVSSTALSTRA